MALFKNAKQVIIPEEMANTEDWLTDKDIIKYFIEFLDEKEKEDTKKEDSQ